MLDFASAYAANDWGLKICRVWSFVSAVIFLFIVTNGGLAIPVRIVLCQESLVHAVKWLYQRHPRLSTQRNALQLLATAYVVPMGLIGLIMLSLTFIYRVWPGVFMNWPNNQVDKIVNFMWRPILLGLWHFSVAQYYLPELSGEERAGR